MRERKPTVSDREFDKAITRATRRIDKRQGRKAKAKTGCEYGKQGAPKKPRKRTEKKRGPHDPSWKAEFITYLEGLGVISEACAASGIPESRVKASLSRIGDTFSEDVQAAIGLYIYNRVEGLARDSAIVDRIGKMKSKLQVTIGRKQAVALMRHIEGLKAESQGCVR